MPTNVTSAFEREGQSLRASCHGSALNRPIMLTIFLNRFAFTKREMITTGRQLPQMIHAMWKANKRQLPLWKVAGFGSLRSLKRSLRHNKNMRFIDGVEADIDGSNISPEEIKAILGRYEIASVIYETPSSVEGKWCYRIICFTSKSLPPEARTLLVARVNGIIGGIADPASFNASQAFYYGRIIGQKMPIVLICDGGFIDLAAKLDATAIGPQRKHKQSPVEVSSPPLDISMREVRRVLTELLLSNPDRWVESREGWIIVGMALHHQFAGTERGFRLWCDFAEDSTKFNYDDQRRVWDSFSGKSGALTFASLQYEARQVPLDFDAFEDLGAKS